MAHAHGVSCAPRRQPFGCFVDVGLKDDGMVHVSELSTQRVDDPHDVVAVGQPVQALAHRSNQPAESENVSPHTGT